MVEIESQGGQTVLKIVIPHKNGARFIASDPKEVIEAFDLVLIDALQKRAESCAAMLARNLDRVIFSSEYMIVFKKQNGSQHSFNIPSYDCMLRGIELLQQKKYENFCLSKDILRQCQKALYWVEKPGDLGIYSFGDLISALEFLVSVLSSKTGE